MTRLLMRCMSFVLAFSCAAGLAADDREERSHERVERALGADRFAAGETALVGEAVSGDLFLAGGEVIVGRPVGGDLLAAGGKIRVDAPTAQDIYAAGGELSLTARVGRNARLAGGTIDVGPQASVAGNLTAAGGQVNVRGAVGGYVQSAGDRIFIDGPVGGDVEAWGRSLELGPSARIAGRLRYAAQTELKRDPAAQVEGGIERMPQPALPDRSGLEVLVFWVWLLGLMLLAAVFVLVVPRLSARIADAGRSRLGLSLLVGFAALIVAPFGVLFLIATGVGAPLGLLLLLIYLAALLLGYVSAGLVLGQTALARVKPAAAGAIGWRAGAAVIGVLVIALAATIPIAGWLFAFLALLVGMGALLMQAGSLRHAAET